MAGPDSRFFDHLGHRGHEPWLEKIEGTVRFDVTEDRRTRHWLLTIRGGQVAVAPGQGAADTVVHADSNTLDRLCRGQVRLLPAFLRNEITVEGQFFFVLVLERLVRPSIESQRPLRGVAARRW